ncbi:aminodeoxychorismate lyase [Ranunculus cassubicifolius]
MAKVPVCASSQMTTIPVYATTKVIAKLGSLTLRKKKERHAAMYSSIIEGITLDPAFMIIPMDDHMVHRPWGV